MFLCFSLIFLANRGDRDEKKFLAASKICSVMIIIILDLVVVGCCCCAAITIIMLCNSNNNSNNNNFSQRLRRWRRLRRFRLRFSLRTQHRQHKHKHVVRGSKANTHCQSCSCTLARHCLPDRTLTHTHTHSRKDGGDATIVPLKKVVQRGDS